MARSVRKCDRRRSSRPPTIVLQKPAQSFPDLNRVASENRNDAAHAVLVLSSYPRKVAFFVAIGLLFAIFSDLTEVGIAGYPPGDALILGAVHVVASKLVAFAVAWRIELRRAEQTTPRE